MNRTAEVNDQQILEAVINNTRTRLSRYRALVENNESRRLLEEIVSSCRQQLDAFLWLCDRTEISDDIKNRQCITDRLEALEQMVVYETEAFHLHEKLLTQPLSPPVRDTLYRVQAAIYDQHLPALRREISAVQAADPVALIDEIKDLMNEKDPVAWSRFFCGPRGALAGGALLGAGVLWLLKDQINLKTKE